MGIYGTRFSRWKFSQKKSIFSKVRKHSKWTLPRDKHLFPSTKSGPGPNCHRPTVFVRDWIFWNFLQLLSLKNDNWAFSEPSPNWAKSKKHQAIALKVTPYTSEQSETTRKIIAKLISYLEQSGFWSYSWCWCAEKLSPATNPTEERRLIGGTGPVQSSMWGLCTGAAGPPGEIFSRS